MVWPDRLGFSCLVLSELCLSFIYIMTTRAVKKVVVSFHAAVKWLFQAAWYGPTPLLWV